MILHRSLGASVASFRQRREQVSSHSRDRLIEGHCETIVKLLGADNTVLAGVHDEASEARVGGVFTVELGQEVSIVDSDNARDIVLTFEGFNLREHALFVLSNSLINDSGENANIRLSASKSDLRLNQLDQTLNEQVLKEGGVLVRVVGEALGHLETGSILKGLNQLVGFLHAVDAGFVLVL